MLIFFITADPITNLWMLVQIVVLTDMWMWIMLVIAFLCPGCFSHSYYLLCSIWLLPSTKVLTFCSDVIMRLPWRLSYKLLPYSALSTLLVVLTPLRDPVYDYIAKRLWLVWEEWRLLSFETSHHPFHLGGRKTNGHFRYAWLSNVMLICIEF